MKTSQDLDLSQILNTFYRRRGMIVAFSLVVFSLASYLAVRLPNVYRSTTLILITPQRLPAAYIASTVTQSIEQRIQTIAQQILSRTSLERIIKEFNLFAANKPGTTMEERVEQLRKKIKIDARRNDTFQLSFDAESPEEAMQVTARLASLFIEENLRVREQQAAGTTAFINAEADRLRKELEEQEAQVNQFRAQYRFELPEQLDPNLRMLDQLRRELESGMLRLSSLQERKSTLERQMAEMVLVSTEVDVIQAPGTGQNTPVRSGVERRRKELETLLRQYSEKHPDVIRLKREIEALGAEEPQESKAQDATPNLRGSPGNSLREMLIGQIDDLKLEIESLRAKNERLRAEVASYQRRVDNTPLRAIEFSKISRNYDITLRKYQDLLAKGLDSELSENMEKKQKGEQFQVVDPASFPQKPVAPNRPRIVLVGLFLGLAGGLGGAFMLENLNTSFKKTEDLDGYIDVPVLATIPSVVTRGTILEERRAQGILVLVSLGSLAVGLVLIRLFGSSLPVF